MFYIIYDLLLNISYYKIHIYIFRKYGSDYKESACNAEDLGLIPGSGGSPREGNVNPLQYSSLEN